MSLGPPAAADVGEAQWQFSAADRFYVGAGTCTSSNCSLYTTNGMLQTGLKPVDTNRCVCKYPYLARSRSMHLNNGLCNSRVLRPLFH
ncbi:hypothetical protein AVEN_231123-1 [Araneus ventricosus]|uniref:Uncharacterized protein n=1 Tax=Araneus ventricosus TaxID=182803 RepID=A0A4Y2RVD2_ARAVE|nr:hypothetical protein AVEN_231123-1 [Araneus ventricosus]